MFKQTEILFANDQQITTQLKQFIESDKTSYHVTLLNDQLTVIITKIHSDQLDDIRMMAGSIARDLGKRHVETAVVSGTNLTETYTNFSDDDVVTAFVEGWHLGSRSEERRVGRALR